MVRKMKTKLKKWQVVGLSVVGVGVLCVLCVGITTIINLVLPSTPTAIAKKNQTIIPEAITPTLPVPSAPATPTILPSPSATETQIVPAAPVTCIPAQIPQLGNVVKVLDGDTIDVVIGSDSFAVRYIGIDAPENENDDPAGLRSMQFNRDMVDGKTVSLYRDQSETDQFGRLLRYVFVNDTFVNMEMVRQGYAVSYLYEPDTSCAEDINQANQTARAGVLGNWGIFLSSTDTPLIVPTLPSRSGSLANCDPSYPTVCIPPPPPDLDCPDIGYTHFPVLPPDPHGFDGDGNGIGCEG